MKTFLLVAMLLVAVGCGGCTSPTKPVTTPTTTDQETDTCSQCGSEYELFQYSDGMCSSKCYEEYVQLGQETDTCSQCGDEYILFQYSDGVCSPECYEEYVKLALQDR